MNQSINPWRKRSVVGRQQRGFTLIELIVATAILVILVGMAFPVARNSVIRQREHELREDLWMIRDAIDRYKDAADRGAFQTKVDSQNYPPDTRDTGQRGGCCRKENEISPPDPG